MASHDKGKLVSSDKVRFFGEDMASFEKRKLVPSYRPRFLGEDVRSESSRKKADEVVALLKQLKEKLVVDLTFVGKESGGGKTAVLWRSPSLGQRREQEEMQCKSGSSKSGEGSPWPPTQRAARSGPIPGYVSRFQAPLDMPELQPQWLEIDDLLHRMRKILHNSMYMDGDRLSPEDETAVRDVLKYHHKSEEKTGPGIDYIKIKQVYDKVTRCFWVVRVDGTEIDFSYHKCLREKAATECPDLLEHYDLLYRSYKP